MISYLVSTDQPYLLIMIFSADASSSDVDCGKKYIFSIFMICSNQKYFLIHHGLMSVFTNKVCPRT